MAHTASILICGAGIVGLTLARDLLAAGYGDILIIDKEPEAGRHASGRNSGVLHAGIYYAPGSLRAQSCLAGNQRMKEYCEERGLPLLKTGKVIVARDESELPTLHELHVRATQNGAKVELIDDQQLAEIEPNAKSAGLALFSHYTAVVDPKAILKSIQAELLASGKVKLLFDARFQGLKHEKGARLLVRTTAGDISCAFFVNAAGAYGDVVAHAFGLGKDYQLIPFKGIYKKLKPEKAHTIRGSIYPVPNIKNPFSGSTSRAAPMATSTLAQRPSPAFGREELLASSPASTPKPSPSSCGTRCFLPQQEIPRGRPGGPRNTPSPTSSMTRDVWSKPCLQMTLKQRQRLASAPQLVDIKKNELVMDFIIEGTYNSTHVLNSISPAFTSSLFFSEMLLHSHVEPKLRKL
jgi:glycine/D-amino acid oxidase-like deaminating enzyme